MELLRMASVRTMPNGRKQSTGLFLCPHCDEKVERVLSDGKKNKSCGCARVKHATSHGLTRGGKVNPLFWVWHGIKARCLNKKHSSYDRYGGRGIGICGSWLEDPEKFFKWAITNGWQRGLEVDRIDNNDQLMRWLR